jgi:putative phage-type endonuclease
MDRKEWKEKRRRGIGGSDSPVVLGVSPFKTRRELYDEKQGLWEQAETPAMKRGTHLEPVAAELYERETGRNLEERKDILVHPDFPWMLANIDRQVVEDERGKGVVEIKCPGIRTFSKCKREGLPNYYGVQLQHYMKFPDFNWGAFVVFSAELWQLLHFDVKPDKDLQNIIVEKGQEFWEMVQKGIPPEDGEGPIVELPEVEGKVYKPDSFEWTQAIMDLREAKQILADAESLEKSAVEKVQGLMGDEYTIAEIDGVRIYWTPQAGRKRFDKTKLLKAHPEINLDEFYVPGKPFRSFRPFFLKERANE